MTPFYSEEAKPAWPLVARDNSSDRDFGGSRHGWTLQANPPQDPVFLVLYPEPAASGGIARLAWYLRDKHRLKGVPLGADRFHVTVAYFGEYAQLGAGAISAIGEAVRAVGMPPFLLGFDQAMSFSGMARRPLVLFSDDATVGAMLFQRELAAMLKSIGIPHRQRHYLPHLTLLYDEQEVPIQAVEEIRWTVREVVLVHSPHGGRRHIPIARWPLRLISVPAGR